MAVNYRAWTWQQKVSRVLLYVGVICLVMFTLFPLYYMVINAFKPLDELVKFPPDFFVRRPTPQNFSDLLAALDGSSVPFIRYIFNSVITVFSVVVLTLLVCTLGAYGLVKHKVLLGEFWFGLIMIALMFSPHTTQIPAYMVTTSLGIADTYWVMILPKIAVAFNFFLVKQFIEQLPNAFLEAARIDGASEMRIFMKIVLPFLKPVCATLVVFSFCSNWNDSNTSVLYITDDALKTLPYALSSINEGATLARMGAVGAAAVVAVIPPIVIFMLMQKQVMETMVHSGIK